MPPQGLVVSVTSLGDTATSPSFFKKSFLKSGSDRPLILIHANL